MSGKKRKAVSKARPAKPEGWTTRGRKPRTEWEQAFWRYLAITVVMSVMYVIYRWHPYYNRNNFKPWHPFFESVYWTWVVLGIPYCVVTLRKFGGRKMDLTDGAVHWAILFRGIFNWLMEECRWPSHIWKNRRMRVSVLSLGVKAFFTPLMLTFMVEHWGNMAALWMKRKGVPMLTQEQLGQMNGLEVVARVTAWWDYLAETVPRLLPTWQGFLDFINVSRWAPGEKWFVFDLYYQLLFFVDTIWALTGYAAESRWLGNKTKSVEPTGFGWMVALMCYPPFNDISGTYFPLGRSGTLFNDESLLVACRVAMLAAFTIYVAATIAFGPTFSNLTNRGIITRGPYAFIRHPAYACKNFAWWMEYLPNAGSPTTFLWLICWNIIYGLRAWTEERHLSKDPEYVAYKKKVPYVAIPGII
ncbi:MAG: hypothetical protein HY904_09045 [Deltaproteobacteria bacterium]|nr:hypothetical protein [Deltaproteobacteria bacterium]